MSPFRLSVFALCATLSQFASAADEEIAILPTGLPEIIPNRLCLWADQFVTKPLVVRRGGELKFGCLLANGTADDLILRWSNTELMASVWNLRSGDSVFWSGAAMPGSSSGPWENYKILFAAPGAPHMDSGNSISIPFSAPVPDFIGTGTLKVRLSIVGFIGATKRKAKFSLVHEIPIHVTE